MRANPWVTAGGVLVGTAIGGASVQGSEREPAGPAPLVFIAPGVVGTAGYALTRRAR